MYEEDYIKKDVQQADLDNLNALDDIFNLMRGGKPERPKIKHVKS